MKVLIAGTFDNFHVGHQWLIWSALRKAKHLTVIVARDATVQRIKQQAPKNNEVARLGRINAELNQEENTYVRLGRADADFWQTVEEVSPNMILLGYDQHFNEVEFKKRFPNTRVKRCTAYQPEWFKSSKF